MKKRKRKLNRKNCLILFAGISLFLILFIVFLFESNKPDITYLSDIPLNNYQKDKFIPSSNINYLNENNDLNQEEKKELLGLIGTLDENTFKDLIYETLNPIGYNLIVTTKEIDFIIEKYGKLISKAINLSLNKF